MNSRQREVFGERCFPSLRELPETVDHALVIVPAAAVPDVLEDADGAGLSSATIYSGAMGDGVDPESKKRGAWLKDFLARSQLRVAGPNCMGAHSYRERLFGYPNTDLCRVPAGPVACIFQSGGTLQFWMKSAAERGLRFSYGITSGNETGPRSRRLSQFPRRRSAHAPDRAVHRRHPPPGHVHARCRTRAGSGQAGAGDQDRCHREIAIGGAIAYRRHRRRLRRLSRHVRPLRHLQLPLARRPGRDRARLPEGGRLPKGPRIGFVTTSGGTVDLLYDYAESEGATMPDFAPET